MNPLNSCCKDVHKALVELYINVKVRNDQSMLDVNADKLDQERQ